MKTRAAASRIVMPYVFVVASVALWSSPLTALAQPAWDFDFEVDGQTPASQPGILYCRQFGTPESSVFTVSGGMLHQRNFGRRDTPGYVRDTNCNYFSGQVDAAKSSVYEARVQILQINRRFGTYFDSANGRWRYLLLFSGGDDPEGVYIQRASGGDLFVPVDIFEMHTYRLDAEPCDPNLRFYIDGALVATVTAPPSGYNGISLVAGSYFNNSQTDADWEYVRFTQEPRSEIALPVNSSVCTGSTALFHIDTHGATARTFQWQFEALPNLWANLSNGPLAGGPTMVNGATTAVLEVSNAQPAAASRYRCLVSSPCDTVTSSAATLVVGRSTGDANSDGAVDLADLAILLSNFGTQSGMTWSHGDFDGNGGIDLADLAALLSAFGTNCL